MKSIAARRRRVGHAAKIAMTAALLAGAGASGLVTATPAQASADASCTSQPVRDESNGYGIMGVGANLKKAPYSECGNVRYLNPGVKLWFVCWVENDYGNFWVWARVDGTQTYGWMYQYNFSEYHDAGGFCPGEPNE